MKDGDKKKIITIIIVMTVVMISMSVYMRVGFNSIKTERRKAISDASNITNEDEEEEEKHVGVKNISIRVGGDTYLMSVDPGDAGQEFAKAAPFELEMNELNGNEKYYTGSDVLPTKPYKPGRIETGDVMLYGDRTIVIFYKSFDTEYEYTRLGKIVNAGSLEYAMSGNKVVVEFFK